DRRTIALIGVLLLLWGLTLVWLSPRPIPAVPQPLLPTTRDALLISVARSYARHGDLSWARRSVAAISPKHASEHLLSLEERMKDPRTQAELAALRNDLALPKEVVPLRALPRQPGLVLALSVALTFLLAGLLLWLVPSGWPYESPAQAPAVSEMPLEKGGPAAPTAIARAMSQTGEGGEAPVARQAGAPGGATQVTAGTSEVAAKSAQASGAPADVQAPQQAVGQPAAAPSPAPGVPGATAQSPGAATATAPVVQPAATAQAGAATGNNAQPQATPTGSPAPGAPVVQPAATAQAGAATGNNAQPQAAPTGSPAPGAPAGNGETEQEPEQEEDGAIQSILADLFAEEDAELSYMTALLVDLEPVDIQELKAHAERVREGLMRMVREEIGS
ncbi:MAG: hypothetical protein H5T69_09960, partial [Chloroflexi bacterium]|nr:hypothetical protein [Chloroflexota bacterium]